MPTELAGLPPADHPRQPGLPEGDTNGRVGQARRQALTLMALLPLSVIVALKVAYLAGDPLFNLYGIAVLALTIAIMYIAFTHYRDPSMDEPVETTRPFVSCLIAVRDDIDVIERCVCSLLESSYETKEVIVIDDCSSDGTGALLEELATRLPIRLITLSRNVGKKRALTIGAEQALGDVFVFTDSDCIVAPDAIERCVLALQAHPEIGAVSGHARALNADVSLLARMQDVWYDGQFGIAKAAESVLGSVTCVSGPLAAFRREAIFNYFPAWAGDRFLNKEFRFATDRQLTGYVLGQSWIGQDLKREYPNSPFVTSVDYPERQWNVSYVRSARVWTNVPSTLKSILKQQARWKKSFVRNLFFTGKFYWRRGFVPALLFYTRVVLVLLAPFMAFRHLVWLPLNGRIILSLTYFAGVLVKGCIWGIAYKIQNPRDYRWIYRPLMSLLSATVLCWLLPYSIFTLRRSRWSRG